MIEEAEHLLNLYSFEEILEINDLTEVDALAFLLEEEFITKPEITELDFDE